MMMATATPYARLVARLDDLAPKEAAAVYRVACELRELRVAIQAEVLADVFDDHTATKAEYAWAAPMVSDAVRWHVLDQLEWLERRGGSSYRPQH